MLQFLQPIWLWAMAGIFIPVLIHLWNHKPGRTLKIGSIFLLTESSRQYAKHIRLADLLLLILRCFLMLLLSMMLAQPVWRQPLNLSKQKGWVLIDMQDIKQTYIHFKPMIDSLLSAGLELHDFNTGFKKENLQQSLENFGDSVPAKTLSYWNIVSALEEEVPSSLPLHLFTESAIQHFRGNRPVISLRLNWHIYTKADTVSAFIADAYAISYDSIRVILGNSGLSGTFYTVHDLSVREQQNQQFHIASGENKMTVSFNNQKSFAVDTAELRISIFTGKYPQDAHYLEAAIEAIQQFSRRKIKLSVSSNVTAIPAKQDWLFWITDQPLPAGNETANVFTYAKGHEEAVHSWLTANNSLITTEPVSLYKWIRGTNDPAVSMRPIWKDGFGRPVLIVENNKQRVYHFFSHFDPAWNDLPWNSAFPALIYQLIDPVVKDNHYADTADRRIIDRKQLQPEKIRSEKSTASEKMMETTALADFLWPVIFLLFFTERIIAFQYKKNKGNG